MSEWLTTVGGYALAGVWILLLAFAFKVVDDARSELNAAYDKGHESAGYMRDPGRLVFALPAVVVAMLLFCWMYLR